MLYGRRELWAHSRIWLRLVARDDGADGLTPTIITSATSVGRPTGGKTKQQNYCTKSLH